MLKGEFSLILSICKSINLCSQSLSKQFTPSVSKHEHMHLDGHPTGDARRMRVALWLLEFITAATGAQLSLFGKWRMKFPRISCSLGNTAASDEKQPWSYSYLTLDELALLRPGITWVPQIPLRYTLRPSRNEEDSKQALFYPIETGAQKGFILQTAIYRT